MFDELYTKLMVEFAPMTGDNILRRPNVPNVIFPSNVPSSSNTEQIPGGLFNALPHKKKKLKKKK
jgi:hypothetical protein